MLACAHAQPAPDATTTMEPAVATTMPPAEATTEPEREQQAGDNDNAEPAATTNPADDAATVAPAIVAEPPATSFLALAKNSPFKSVVKNSLRGGAGSSAASNQIQFRGILKIGSQTEYGLYDPVSQRSFWVKLREQNRFGVYAESYDAAKKTLTIESTTTGRLTLTLPNPDETPLAVSSNAAYRGAGNSGGNNARQFPQQNNNNNNRQNQPPNQQNQQNRQNNRNQNNQQRGGGMPR